MSQLAKYLCVSVRADVLLACSLPIRVHACLPIRVHVRLD